MLRKAKTISELFQETKEFDLVITNDAPLATALNKLVEAPRLDYFAMTPKQIASKFAQLNYIKVYEKYEIILNLSRDLKKPLKLVHGMAEKIYEIWMYNAKLEFADQFLSEEEKLLSEYISRYDTIETAMENFNEEFFGDRKIAVIGEELFSLLDLEVLPKRGVPAQAINIFTEDTAVIDKAYIFNSSGRLIENVLMLINKDNADETAIVLSSESDHLEILKARLKDSDINIEIKNYLSDEISVRNFISLIELSLRFNELKVKEYIAIAGEYGISIDNYHNNYDIVNYVGHINKDKKLKKLSNISQKITEHKYGELISILKLHFQTSFIKEFNEAINLLELSDQNISEDNLIDLKYFIREFNIEIKNKTSGVLFVNALNSAFIDRQIIYYLEMDNSWMKLFPDKDYLNKEEEELKNLNRFQILLQQGQNRFYFVQNVRDYKKVIPCYYFLMLAGADAGSFVNEIFNPVQINNKRTEDPFKARVKKLNSVKDPIVSVSPTSFNKYFKCPKLFSFDRFLPSEDLLVFKKGNLLHNFAELYFNHPDFTKKKLDTILDKMTKDLESFNKEINQKFVRSEFLIGAESLMFFLDTMTFIKIPLEIPEQANENILMNFFKKDIIYQNTERRIPENDETKIKGKIDLQSGNTIVDYKSSKKRKYENNATLKSNLDYINGFESAEVDFQAAAYIAVTRGKFDDVNFIYNFLFTNFKYHIDTFAKKENNLTNIKYLPITFMEHIYSEEVFEMIKKEKKAGKLFDTLGLYKYKYILDNLNLHPFEFFDKEILLNKILEITNFVIQEKGYSYSNFGCQKQETLNDNCIKPISDIIFGIRNGNHENATIFKDDIDNFTRLIKDELININKYTETVFPFRPLFGSREICKECNYLNLCTGNKLWH
ncbi:MAG: PD-(D/E)XK nuclease family protein [Ignavibacteria bacterium]